MRQKGGKTTNAMDKGQPQGRRLKVGIESIGADPGPTPRAQLDALLEGRKAEAARESGATRTMAGLESAKNPITNADIQ
jgi:hypothetical protein